MWRGSRDQRWAAENAWRKRAACRPAAPPAGPVREARPASPPTPAAPAPDPLVRELALELRRRDPELFEAAALMALERCPAVAAEAGRMAVRRLRRLREGKDATGHEHDARGLFTGPGGGGS